MLLPLQLLLLLHVAAPSSSSTVGGIAVQLGQPWSEAESLPPAAWASDCGDWAERNALNTGDFDYEPWQTSLLVHYYQHVDTDVDVDVYEDGVCECVAGVDDRERLCVGNDVRDRAAGRLWNVYAMYY